ncbi:surface-anchored protein [Arcanobacterium pluranimalium]|uniref:choice-of-anchor M domain-containing protein n=1 Tax=Arcanobacterium pluranimalium TaxID=108028 RepID=UPI00195CA596|nr:choice-of-anchor M domain-containing protein [Arcanobacterium pluranimalium]MBM7824627.1 surface-anchored protein [Arcanobacterium pluranimalium]
MKLSRACARLALVCAALFALPTAAVAEDAPKPVPADPALTQVVDANETVAPRGTPVEISAGHVDMGPKFIDGTWTLMARDDVSKPPTWRHLDDVVFRVRDKGKIAVPKGNEYSFIKSDKEVWVVPQQEIANVVWLGWNTQDPNVVSKVNGGVSLIFGGHQGPGNFNVFLQAGNFAGPQQLWKGDSEESQPIHVDLNTHTHANWVFTEPGIHLVRITAQAQLKDGTTVENTQLLRFAVGDAANAQKALSAKWEKETAPAAPAKVDEPSAVDKSTSLPLIIGLGLLAVAAVVVLGITLGRRATKKRQAEAAAAVGNTVPAAPAQDVSGKESPATHTVEQEAPQKFTQSPETPGDNQ